MMNQQDILRKIGNIIQELKEQHQYLSEAKDINTLELELFKANADFLTDHISIFEKLNTIVAPVITSHQQEQNNTVDTFYKETKAVEEIVTNIAQPEIVHFEDKAQQHSVENIQEEINVKSFKFDFSEPTDLTFDFEKELPLEQVFDRQLTPEEQIVVDDRKRNLEEESFVVEQKKSVEDLPIIEIKEAAINVEEPIISRIEPVLEIKEEIQNFFVPEVKIEAVEIKEGILPAVYNENLEEKPVVNAFVSSNTAAPYQQEINTVTEDKPKSLNDILSEKNQVKNTSYSKPIADLKTIISLNDKMIFIKELFNGYNLAYSEAVEILNRFDNLETADSFLQKNYAEKNNWGQKQAIVNRFYEILNRKFKN